MYIWLTAPNFAFGDWRIEVVESFIDALDLMVGCWYNIYSFDIISYFLVDSTCYSIPFDGLFIVELFWVSTYPSKVFQLVCDCLPYSPFQWPFHPNLWLWFLTYLMIFFHIVGVLICLWGREPYSQGFSTHYMSVWLDFWGCDFSNSPWI